MSERDRPREGTNKLQRPEAKTVEPFSRNIEEILNDSIDAVFQANAGILKIEGVPDQVKAGITAMNLQLLTAVLGNLEGTIKGIDLPSSGSREEA